MHMKCVHFTPAEQLAIGSTISASLFRMDSGIGSFRLAFMSKRLGEKN